MATEIDLGPGQERPLVVPLAPVQVPALVKNGPPKKTPGPKTNPPSTPPPRNDPAATGTSSTSAPPRNLTVPPPPPPIEKKQPKTQGMTGPRSNPYEPKPNPL